MTQAIESISHLQIKGTLAILSTFLSCLLILKLLINIEHAKDTTSHSKEDHVDTILSEFRATDAPTNKEPDPPSHTHLSSFTYFTLSLYTLILILFIYLLLVCLPTGTLWWNLLAISFLLTAILRTQIISEVRQSRYDRLSAIVTLVIVLASSMSVLTYTRLSLKEGSMYEGSARIVGYDDEVYNTTDTNSTVRRTDLEVAWGGMWGCPETGKLCQSVVSGALCETELDDRRLEGDTELDDDYTYYDDLWEETMELYYKNEELDYKNEQLYYTNEQLQEENEDLEEEVEELEEEVEENSMYSFQDDMYNDDYWNVNWDSFWGDYACSDLFETDLEGQTYDGDTSPGDDGWPFIDIVGKCKTCEAYILDEYSLQTVSSIERYQESGLQYASVGLVSLLLTMGLGFIQWKYPTVQDTKVELLRNDGTTIT